VSETLEFLELCDWRQPVDNGCDHTLCAISTLQSLRFLSLEKCPGVTHQMLEPLLIGDPLAQAPRCAKVSSASGWTRAPRNSWHGCASLFCGASPSFPIKMSTAGRAYRVVVHSALFFHFGVTGSLEHEELAGGGLASTIHN
jgi:hypothetical protein